MTETVGAEPVTAADVALEPATAAETLLLDLRKIAAVVAAGLATGFVFLGWGSRLAMMLLARLNPEMTGRLTDDDFVIGQFDLGATLGLVAFCTFAGMVTGLVFLAIRQLRFGPAWFRTWSMIIGPGVVGGAILVHDEGIDFHLLDPAALAIALFVLVPALHAWALVRLGDHWLREDSWFLQGRAVRALPSVLVLGTAIFVVVPVLALAGHVMYASRPRLQSMIPVSRIRDASRAVLAAVFVVALVELVRDSIAIL